MTHTHHRFRPSVEPLEDRLVPVSTRLVLDFTPDRGSRNQFPGSNRTAFAQIFQDAARNGSKANFLDFNGNGVVDATADAEIAANIITNLMADYFRPFLSQNVQIMGVDFLEQTNRGTKELNKGLRSPKRQTFVMFVGGSTADEGVYGESYQAAVGFNNEDFGRTYSGAIARQFQFEKPNAEPLNFAKFVASTVAHEFGHLLGLGHPIPDYTNAHNVMDSSSAGQGDEFLNRPYQADLFRRPSSLRTGSAMQNPFDELMASFRGQRTEGSTSTTRLRSGPHGHHHLDG